MNLIRYYNQNRKKIWGILIIIVSAFILLQLVSYVINKNNENATTIKTNTVSEINTNTATVTTKKSVISGENLSEDKLQSAVTVVDNFISYCNEKDLQRAYDLLTKECKEQMYTSLEVFEQAYYNDVFGGERKICTIENWIKDTYKVKITEDMLSTGKSNNGYAKQDYITVEKEDNIYKLNINNYIGYKQINEITNQDNINMEVLYKNTYMDYEEYTIKITNNTDSTILLDSRSNVKTLYLQDSKGMKYSSYGHELTEPMLTIPSRQTKEVTIKFYSSYMLNKKIDYIVFSDVLLKNGQLSEKIEFKANV